MIHHPPKASDDETPSTSGYLGKYVLKSLPKMISKIKDQDVPLPNQRIMDLM